jgi:hypothetical protein
MKFTTKELSDLSAYLQKFYPAMEMRFREDHEDVLEFSKYGLLFYKVVINVGRINDKGEIIKKKEPVFFLETPVKEIRKTPGFDDIVYSLILYCVAEDMRDEFDKYTTELLLMHDSGEYNDN